MTWVIFTEDFDYHPTESSTIAFKASPKKQEVREECAAAAEAAGKATRAKTPTRLEKDALNGDASA